MRGVDPRCYISLALLALHQGWGIVGVWAGLAALFAVRLVTLGVRFAGERWGRSPAPRRSTFAPRMRRIAALPSPLRPARRRPRLSALAQQSPFGPLPQPAEPTPTPTPNTTNVLGQERGADDPLHHRRRAARLLRLHRLVDLPRRARSTLHEDPRSAEAERRRHDPHERHRREREKERARKKTRAQKQARKAHRKR